MSTTGQDYPRDGNGRWVRTTEGRERDALALDMKSNGRTYQEIADALGYASKGNARRGVETALAEIHAPTVEAARTRMLEEIEVVKRRVWQFLEEDLHVFDKDGNELEIDPSSSLKAATELNRLWATERAVLGLDAPSKTEVAVTSVKFSIDGLDPGDV